MSSDEPGRQYLNNRQVAELLGISIATVYRYREGKGVPVALPMIRLNRRKVVYELGEVQDWMDAMKEEAQTR